MGRRNLKPQKTVWCLVGNGGMDPYSSPYIIPNNSLHNPFPHSLLRTRQKPSSSFGASASPRSCRFLGSPVIKRVPCFLLFAFNRGTQKGKVQKGLLRHLCRAK